MACGAHPDIQSGNPAAPLPHPIKGMQSIWRPHVLASVDFDFTRQIHKARAETALACCRKLFKMVNVLGQGNFSKVMRVQHRLDGTEYAVKRSIRPVMDDSDLLPWTQVGHMLISESYSWLSLRPYLCCTAEQEFNQLPLLSFSSIFLSSFICGLDCPAMLATSAFLLWDTCRLKGPHDMPSIVSPCLMLSPSVCPITLNRFPWLATD